MTYISRKLGKSKQNYHANEIECLELVWALGKICHYVYGWPLTVNTDSSDLCWLLKRKDVNGKFARWITTLQEHKLNIPHLRGTANVVADTLSRAPARPTNENELMGDVIAAVGTGGYSCKEIGFLQHADKEIQQIVLALQSFPNTFSPLQATPFTLHEGVLYEKKCGERTPVSARSAIHYKIRHFGTVSRSPDGGHKGERKNSSPNTTTILVEKNYGVHKKLRFLPSLQAPNRIASRETLTLYIISVFQFLRPLDYSPRSSLSRTPRDEWPR